MPWYPGRDANELAKAAQARYEYALDQLRQEEAATDQLAKEYGQFQFRVIEETIKPFVEFIRRTGRKASQKDRELLDGVEFSVQQIKEYEAAVLEAEQFFSGGVKAAAASAAGYGGAISVATTIGAASTGTAISTLSGAAAWNATLAWFGGGAIAAGGGGMALGAMVLGGITVLPALGVGMFIAHREGEKAMTKARKYAAEANIAVADMKRATEFAHDVQHRIAELRAVLEAINDRALDELNKLDPNSFDPQKDGEKFMQVQKLIESLAEFLKAPVLNKEGKLDLGTVTILEKYRHFQGN